MTNKLFITPDFLTAIEIKKIRKKLGFTQKEFAFLLNCSVSTIERWETSEKPVNGPIVLALSMLERYPEYAAEIKVSAKKYPLRLWYMHKQKVCTLIEVDEIRKKIKTKNYTDNIMFKAFGVNDQPEYEDYLQFLESRCFHESRDKMKLVLKDLDLPFYDPFMIIEKTEGRMAEDDFWIRIER